MSQEFWITIVSVLGTILLTILGFLIDKIKRERMLKELCNYIFGQVDILLSNKIKVEPEIRAAMKKASKKYHSLDLVKDKEKK